MGKKTQGLGKLLRFARNDRWGQQKRNGGTPFKAHQAGIQGDIPQGKQHAGCGAKPGAVQHEQAYGNCGQRHDGQHHARDGVAQEPGQGGLVGVEVNEPGGDNAPHHQGVQVQAVGCAGGGVRDAPAVNAEQHFCHGVDANEQGHKGADAGVALDQQHAGPGQGKAAKVTAAIAQKEFPPGPVDEPKAHHGGGNGGAGHGKVHVAHHCSHRSQPAQRNDHKTTGQTVKAIHNVDGIGHTTHGKGGKGYGNEGVLEQWVNPRNIQRS